MTLTTHAAIDYHEARTNEALEDGRHEWAKMGFLSRFIIFSYSYSMSTIDNLEQLLRAWVEYRGG